MVEVTVATVGTVAQIITDCTKTVVSTITQINEKTITAVTYTPPIVACTTVLPTAKSWADPVKDWISPGIDWIRPAKDLISPSINWIRPAKDCIALFTERFPWAESWLERSYFVLAPYLSAFNLPPGWALWLLSIPLLYLLATRHEESLDEIDEIHAQNFIAFRLAWCKVRSYRALAGLVEQWIYGRIPWGPWDASYIQHHWPDKRFMKRLIRCGIIPLDIREGGTVTYQEEEEATRGWRAAFPVIVKSRSRPYFEFLVIHPDAMRGMPRLNKARMRFLKDLSTQERFPITMVRFPDSALKEGTLEDCSLRTPTECLAVGKRSRLPFLLPFKSDFVRKAGGTLKDSETVPLHLKDHVQSPLNDMPLVACRDHTVIRVESLRGETERLDEFVYQIAFEAGLEDVWTEDEMIRAVAALCEHYGIELGSQVDGL
ncbi:hypothetical protein M011DRAFT_481393 [Sporormia fimetaria CBS 119925]|uniref:Uncharacterized protein n=1 Tax=Sporormia fimetaria CBS 119925 TaxID=1340428 RepID=A0A6A6V0D8_9PLEO|nr:hypothetical protein M011DRAFT_481393 [Sporormia fimetaria CBS 119925]